MERAGVRIPRKISRLEPMNRVDRKCSADILVCGLTELSSSVLFGYQTRGLESPRNPQTRMSALHRWRFMGSVRAFSNCMVTAKRQSGGQSRKDGKVCTLQ